MTASEILSRYDAEIRADPPAEPGVRFERAGNIVRAVGRYNCILFSDLGGVDADAAIAAQAAFFRASGRDVEWKVYGHDRPSDLGARLSAAGFIADPQETLMAFDLAHDLSVVQLPSDIAVRRVDDARGLADLIAVNDATWARDHTSMYESYALRLRDPSLALYVAYDGSRPVAAGRLEMPQHRSFAGLWGGCTVPAYRGRGIFRAVVAARWAEALKRIYSYLNVDAAETSRPILERLGFVALTSVTGWILKAARP